MGFKDFFSKGPTGRNDGANYNQGLNASYSSATNRRYQNSMSANGLQSTYTLRQQQPHVSDRAMSLSSRSFRPSDQPRTMSMRSGAYSHQPGSRAMSMTASSRPNRPASVNSRANSLTASTRAYQKAPGSRLNSMSGSRVGSRANSLRANSLTPSTAGQSHTKIIKTTKEKDYSGRTKSITTTTIEKRGNMKIVRTTVIQPSDQRINEDAELEELAELEDFDHDATVDDFHQNDDAAYQNGQYIYGNEYNQDYSNMVVDDNGNYVEDYNEKNYYEDPVRNGAALAAAVALNNGNQKFADRPQARAQAQKKAKQNPSATSQRTRKREIQHAEGRPEVRFGESEIVDDAEGYDYQENYQNDFDNDFDQQEYQPEPTKRQVNKSTKLSKKQKSKPISPGGANSRNIQKNQAIAAANSPSSSGTAAPSNRTRKLDPPNVTRTQQSPITQKPLSVETTPQSRGLPINDNDASYYDEQQIATPTQPSRAHFNDIADDLVSNEDYEDNVGNYNDDDEDEVMVVTPEMSISESFNTRAQKRLSEIAEVTETYDDDDEVDEDQDFMEEPILNPLGIDTAIPATEDVKDKRFKGKATLKDNFSPATESRTSFVKPTFADNVGTTNSSIVSDDNFVEAQEELVSDPPAITDINDRSGIPKSQSLPFNNKVPQAPASHTYRNLLFNESKRSPIKNSIPTFNSVHNDYVNDDSNTFPQQKEIISAVSSQSTSPVVYQNNFNNFDQQEDELYTSPADRPPRKLRLKSVLKNSSSSLASPVSENNPQFTKYGVGGGIPRNRSQIKKSVSSPIENPRKELTPEEMYALALKAAERKVYGDRLDTVYPDNDIDDDTKLNTIVNMQAPQETKQIVIPSSTSGVVANPDQGYGTSQPGVPYQSNATGLGFRVHSLRDGTSPRQLKKSDPQEASRLKRFFKHEQKQQRKQWEEERKAATESELVQKAAQKVEKEVSMMPVNPDVELHILQQQEQVKQEQHKLEQLRQQQQQTQTPIQEQSHLPQEPVLNGLEPQAIGSGPAVETQSTSPAVAQQIQQPLTANETAPLPQQSKSALQPLAQTNGTSTTAKAPTSQSASEPSSPNRLRLKMFSFGKKKSTPDHYTHQKQASLVSQETHKSTASVSNRRGSVDGKKSKFFSFGLGGSHDSATTASQDASKLQKVKSVPNAEIPQNIQNSAVVKNSKDIQDAQNVSGVQKVEKDAYIPEIANKSNGQNIPATEAAGSVQEIANIGSNVQNSENTENVQAQPSVWSDGTQPLKSAEITTIPEVENDMSAPLADIEEEKFAQPSFPGVHPTNDNFVRGPHGSSSNLMKVGTVNSSVTNGSAYTSNNISAGNLESVNPTDSSKLASSEAQNLAFSTPANGDNIKTIHAEAPTEATAQVVIPQSQVAEESSAGRKAGKQPKSGRKFMKFFNL